jgi:uncharacterized protein (DUF1684 family)
MRVWWFGVVAAGMLTAGCGRSTVTNEAPASDASAHAAEVEQWRAQHDESYRRNYVTIAGLHPLKPGSNTAGSAGTNDVVLPDSVPPRVGRFVLQPSGVVRFEPEAGVPITLRGSPVTAPLDLKNDAVSDPDELVLGDVRVVVHQSGAAQMIRVRDPNGPWATGFVGFTWFPIDPRYRVVGRFVADAQPQTVRVPNTFGDIDEFSTEGVVEFTLEGQTVRLRPFTTRPNRFWFVFRDASSGKETYAAARFLYADLASDGSVVLDFNKAYNPPCAFNPYTTCPIPMPENRLTTVSILSGEKDYPIKVELPNPGT